MCNMKGSVLFTRTDPFMFGKAKASYKKDAAFTQRLKLALRLTEIKSIYHCRGG
jgi:hypothetical protein